MALLKSAIEGSGELLKKMFSRLYDGEKSRTINVKPVDENKKKASSEYELLANAVEETNEILSQTLDVQRHQNKLLADILENIQNLKPGKATKTGWLDTLTDLLEDLSGGDKKKDGKAKPRSRAPRTPRMPRVSLPSVVNAGRFGAVAGLGYLLYDSIKTIKEGIEEYSDIPNRPDYEKLTDYHQKVLRESAAKQTGAQIINFKARDIKFTAKDMLIKAGEIKINDPSQPAGAAGGATPAAPPSAATPNVLGATPTTPGSKPGGDSGPGGLTSVTTKSGPSTKVGATYAPNFQSFIDDLEATGYKITSLGGYANRANANNPSVKSYHAMGAAIDINPASNPNRSTKTDLPQETAALAAKHGLGWGMNWTSVKDPMHFSAAKAEQGSFDIKRESMAGYASGTDYVPETGPAIVGEKGPELVIGRDGSQRVTESGAHVEELHRGDSVLPADKTKKLVGYGDGTTQAEKEVSRRGGHRVDRSGSYMSRPRFYQTEDQLYAAMGERTAEQRDRASKETMEVSLENGEKTTFNKADYESYQTIKAFERGEKPAKPESMTTKEYQWRMRDYGGAGLISGAISPDEWEKTALRAEQPLWKDKAQNKAAAFSNAARQQQPAVRPLIASADTDASKFAAMDYVEPKAPPPPPMPEPPPVSKAPTASAKPPTLYATEYDAMGSVTMPSGMGPSSGELLKAYLTSGQ